MMQKYLCGNCGEENECDPDNPPIVDTIESRDYGVAKQKTFYYECITCGELNIVREPKP